MTIVIPVGFYTSGVTNNDTPSLVSTGTSNYDAGLETADTIGSSTVGYVQATARS